MPANFFQRNRLHSFTPKPDLTPCFPSLAVLRYASYKSTLQPRQCCTGVQAFLPFIQIGQESRFFVTPSSNFFNGKPIST
jgi:hypothetical protein